MLKDLSSVRHYLGAGRTKAPRSRLQSMSSSFGLQIGLLSLVLASSFAYVVSESVAYGDAPYYANDISNWILIEPGHLLWRPLGAAGFSLVAFLGYQGDVLWVLQGINGFVSVGAVLASYCFLSRWATPMVALWGSSLVAFSNGFWAYSVSGSSYTAGLLFVLLALILVTPPGRHHRLSFLRTLSAGLCGGMAALFWLVYGLLFPVLLGFVAISTNGGGSSQGSRIRHLGVFFATYSATVGLALVGCYLLLPTLEPYATKDIHNELGFVGWLASSSHGIQSRFGLVQVLRWNFGWAQSFIAFGDMGQSVRLWITDGVPLQWKSFAIGSMLLLLFYGFLGACVFKLWRQRRTIRTEHRWVLGLAAFSIILNSVFALSWQATDLERYMSSLPFIVLIFCLTIDLERSTLRREVIMLLGVGVLVAINAYMTIYPIINSNSDKNRWLSAIHQHLKKEDLLIVLGTNKFRIMDPHNPSMPTIHNVSMNILLHSSPQSVKTHIFNDIQQTRNRGGRIFIGESVLGLDPQPRDGWSFREHPDPSPKDLDHFFSPMKGQFAFSVAGERVWKTQ